MVLKAFARIVNDDSGSQGRYMITHRGLKLDGAIGDFTEPSEGGKLAILLHNGT